MGGGVVLLLRGLTAAGVLSDASLPPSGVSQPLHPHHTPVFSWILLQLDLFISSTLPLLYDYKLTVHYCYWCLTMLTKTSLKRLFMWSAPLRLQCPILHPVIITSSFLFPLLFLTIPTLFWTECNFSPDPTADAALSPIQCWLGIATAEPVLCINKSFDPSVKTCT